MPPVNRVTLACTSDELSMFKRYAKSRGMPMSRCIRELAKSAIETAALGDSAVNLKDLVEQMLPMVAESALVARNALRHQFPDDVQTVAIAQRELLKMLAAEREQRRR